MSEESLIRARMMARIAAPLLAASIRQGNGQEADPEDLAQRFASDINMVVPLTQLLVEVIKPADGVEQASVNAIAAPLAAALVSQNPALVQESDGLTRLLKPSLNVLASFCDGGEEAPGLFDEADGLPAAMLALTPIVGCLSRHAFGKSPAKRLTDTLDAYSRARKDVLAELPKSIRPDGALNIALQGAAAQLFASHFDALMAGGDAAEDKSGADAQFKELLAQWTQSLLLLSVLLRHVAGGESEAAPAPSRKSRQTTATAAAAKPQNDDDEDDDEGAAGSGGGGGRGQKMQAGYNPMSFFAKKGV